MPLAPKGTLGESWKAGNMKGIATISCDTSTCAIPSKTDQYVVTRYIVPAIGSN